MGRRKVCIVSMPDFFNADVGDLRQLATWQPPDVNSINNFWRRSIDVCLDEVEAENPYAVLVAGDQVEGHWDKDPDNEQMFGPNDTDEQKKDCVRNAADLYYPFYKDLFSMRNLTLHAAIGDHEIGDDRYRGDTINDRWDPRYWPYTGIDVFKNKWTEHFMKKADGTWKYAERPLNSAADGTAYAVDLPDNITLVTVDCFTKTDTGVNISVEFGQLGWLDRVLGDIRNRGRIAIVQGHVPVAGPVRTRYSGGLYMHNRRNCEFWQTLVKHKVRLYLCGEVHDVTCIAYPGEPVQISHGSLFHRGFNYLRIDTAADGSMQISSREVKQTLFDDTAKLWSTDPEKRPAREIDYARGAYEIGHLSLDATGAVIARTGMLAPYTP